MTATTVIEKRSEIEIIDCFEYHRLDNETRIIVEQRTDEIKTLLKRTAQDIVDIGQKLTDVKDRLGHGHFGTWLAAEFRWTARTAQRFIRVADTFKSDNLSDLEIAPSALYMLAAPSTPAGARQEAIVRAKAGEPISYKTSRDIVNSYKSSSSSNSDDNDQTEALDRLETITSGVDMTHGNLFMPLPSENKPSQSRGIPGYVLEEEQPQPCPQCGEQRVRGVNGSQRWCIGCGANWPSASTFLTAVAATRDPQPERLRRELGRRFTNLLQRLSAPQLVQVERQLFELEQQLTAPVGAVN